MTNTRFIQLQISGNGGDVANPAVDGFDGISSGGYRVNPEWMNACSRAWLFRKKLKKYGNILIFVFSKSVLKNSFDDREITYYSNYCSKF